jgi:2,3-bisphosphoglycerate-independent phosphoglycerate mutase
MKPAIKTSDPREIIKEISESTHTDEETVAYLYAEMVDEYRRSANILDYVSLLAAKRVRERLQRH